MERRQLLQLALAGGSTDYQNGTNVRLHKALAMVVAGGVEQGVRKATEIIDAVPVAYRSHMIMETGRLVLRTVPAERGDEPAVAEFCQVLAGGHN